MSSVRFVTEIPGAGGLLLYKHTRMGKICQICFRQRRLSKKSSLAILLFVSAQSYIEYLIFSYDIIFSYYILHHQYIYINTYNVTFRTKEITRISVCRAIDP